MLLLLVLFLVVSYSNGFAPLLNDVASSRGINGANKFHYHSRRSVNILRAESSAESLSTSSLDTTPPAPVPLPSNLEQQLTTQARIEKQQSRQSGQSRPQKKTVRHVRRIEKFARLPVWPVWNGVLIWLVSRVLGAENAAKLENAITGRVCPNFYNYDDDSNPYIMLVHHCHSFAAWDPLRYLQRTFFPEGFPAHPHRGFVTITYILHGGFVHRDSVGIKQLYGNDIEAKATTSAKEKNTSRYKGKHTQWLSTGRGMLHEEMFDIVHDNLFATSRQELYQIWLNVPASHKMDTPSSVLLGGENETPLLVDVITASQTLVLAGTYHGRTAASPTLTDLALFHVTLPNGASSWTFDIPATHTTAFIYVRTGSLSTTPDQGTTSATPSTGIIPTHHTAYFEATGDTFHVTANSEATDFMFLSGAPIAEPCVASGSMVMTNSREIEQAYADYQRGKFGLPWEHVLSDAEWQGHVQNQGRPR